MSTGCSAFPHQLTQLSKGPLTGTRGFFGGMGGGRAVKTQVNFHPSSSVTGYSVSWGRRQLKREWIENYQEWGLPCLRGDGLGVSLLSQGLMGYLEFEGDKET